MGRLVIFIGFVILSMLGGFRSTVIMFLLTFGILFYLEGLLRYDALQKKATFRS